MAKGSLLQVNVKLLKCFSLYPPKPNAHILVIIIDRLYKFIAVATLYCVIIPCAYELYLGEKSEITDYTLNIMNTGAYLCSILTLHFFHSRSEIGRDLVTEMNQHFKYSTGAGITDISMVRMDKLTRKVTIGFVSLLNTGVISMALVPLLMEGRVLPVPGVFPFKWTETPNYQLLFIFQSYAQIIIGCVTSSSDSFFISILLLAAEEFKILASDLHNCLYNALLDFGISKDVILNFKDSLNQAGKSDIFKSLDKSLKIPKNLNATDVNDASEQIHLMEVIASKDFESKLGILLINSIKHHQTLLNFCEKIENFFWPLIFMKAATSMFYHIFITFAIVTSTDTSMAFTLAQYELCAVVELFIFALAGQALINESENVQQQLYTSPWYLCNKEYRQSVSMILMRCHRPSRVSVGKLVDMSLTTFILIMKTALSYFAVLRQMTE